MALIAACGSDNSSDSKNENAASANDAAPTDVTQSPDYKAGLALIGQSDCFTCHKVNEKLTGPAYADVAKKYAGSDTAINYLAHKIIEGGSGVWGTLQMIPHPQISQGDAEKMAKYVLLLKDAQ